MDKTTKNIDFATVADFGKEWRRFDQHSLTQSELATIFFSYFKIFPFELLNANSVGADIGCGSGRWAQFIASKVKKLYCVDASEAALSVAKKNLNRFRNIEFIHSPLDQTSIPNESLDFAYSLGVLHHLPDTFAGIKACVSKLKKNAPLLIYLYYAFDNKPRWFRLLWKGSDLIRKMICRLPFKLKFFISQCIALFIYYPLAKLALFCEKFNYHINHFPLAAYRNRSFYIMRNDALDRFSTRVEHRFTRQEIINMLEKAGLTKIKISPDVPYWCVLGYKS